MAGITLSEVLKQYGSRTLFENVNISFNPGHRYALTGPNGAGKSTLLKMIMKQEEITGGEISLPERVGMLRQNIEDFKEFRAIDVVIMGNKPLWKALQEQEELYGKEEMTDDDGMRLGELAEVIATNDGYEAESNAEVLLEGIGIPKKDFEEPMKALPTDYQFRILLCQALFGNPEALLLDEPTNHLDLDSIAWLEEFLFNYSGTLVVVSHDRHFLNSVATDIADIDYDTIILYPGNYDMMVAAKTSTRSQAELEAKSKEKKIAQLREFVAKFGAGTRASQVQSRVREIERLKPQELKKSNIERPYIRFIPTDKQPGQVVLKAKKLSKSYDDKQVIKNFSIEINKGDKIGIIGPNGLGKSTLVKLLTESIAANEGSIEHGNNVQIAYFPQEHSEVVDKSKPMQAVEWLKSKQPKHEQEIRSAMGKMLFSGDDAFKNISTLSGGETARLILAEMMLLEHNVLVLDEPNGHLDLEAVSALSWGLHEYPGTVIVVSHDRDLIETVAKKIIAFTPEGIVYYDGPYSEYMERREQIAKK